MAARKPAAKVTAKQPAARSTGGKSPAGAKSVIAERAPPRAAALSPTKATPVPTVTLRHLAAELTGRHQMPKKQADRLLTDIVGLLVAHLTSGDRLRINGLGILQVKSRPARMGRNPATGEAVQVKASRKIAFRAAKELKQAI